MLTIKISSKEGFDDKNNRFISVPECTICVEHSLVSISKWESKWHKPFLSDSEKTDAELRDYIRCMTITQNVKDEVYETLSVEELKAINDYIGDSMTATTITDRRPESQRSHKIITSEQIYSWMVNYRIPFECQRWHLNRLLTLIRILNIENDTGKGKYMSRRAATSSNAALNAARRKATGSKG